MPVIDLNAAIQSDDDLAIGARALADASFAAEVLVKWQHEVTQPNVRTWLFHLGIVAAARLDRTDEFISIYNRFLVASDLGDKPDWHFSFTENAAPNDMLGKAGRLGQTGDEFAEEFRFTVQVLGPPALGAVLDVGCAAGAFTINLALLGYEVTGTDHHAGVIEKAREHAIAAGANRITFMVDDATKSRIAPGTFSRAICISVTVCLPNNTAFESLVAHLDRITRSGPESTIGRRVILGSNRWGPSRLQAVREILTSDPQIPELAFKRLRLLQVSWWMFPEHLDVIRKYFRTVTEVRKTVTPIGGERIEFLLE